MVKKTIKNRYVIEYDENQNISEDDLNRIVEDSIEAIEHQEKPIEPKLVHADGRIVQKGDEVIDFRGDKAIVVSWVPPKFEGKSGKVYVKENMKNGQSWEMGYYPEVYGLKWIDLPWDKKDVEDIFVEDIPVNAPEEKVDITYTEKLKGGKNALTYGMIEEAYKQREKDEGQTFRAYVDVAIQSLKEDIANAKYIISGEMKSTRKLLLEDYVKIEHLIKKAGMEDKLSEISPLIDELGEKLDLNYFKQPKFKKKEMKLVSKELRNKHRFDSVESECVVVGSDYPRINDNIYLYNDEQIARFIRLGKMYIAFEGSHKECERYIQEAEQENEDEYGEEAEADFVNYLIVDKEVLDQYKMEDKATKDSNIAKTLKPVFLCSKADLTASYNDAKQGKLPQVFEANLRKVGKDIEADYDRINQGRDHYLEDPRIVKVLPEIVDLYQTAIKYAEDLEYKDIAREFAFMLNTIKKGWGLE